MRSKVKRKIISIIILAIFLVSTTPSVFGGKGKGKGKGKPHKDNEMEIVLSYAGADIDFGVTDYSGISYFVDSVEYFTDVSGIITATFNNVEEHNFTLLWHGVINTFMFSESITDAVVLATKSIEVNTLWAEVLTPVEGISIQVWYYDGTTWSLIETAITDSSGVATISSLVMGLYVVSEVGDFNSINNFTVDQLTTLYTAEVLSNAVKTIIDVDYLDSVFGTDYSVDLSMITWAIEYLSTPASYPTHYDGIIVDEANGIVTVYNLDFTYAWRFVVSGYAGASSWLLVEGLNEINLDAKSLEAEFLWSSDNTPVIDYSVELFWYNGVDFESIGMYVTDVNGKVIITEMLPMGTYKLNDYTSFDIIASTITQIEQCIVSSTIKVISAFRGFYPNIFWEDIFGFFLYFLEVNHVKFAIK